MTTFYCIKSTREVMGTHKAWLALRDNDPARFEALRNQRPSDIELVRIGDFTPSKRDTIKHYGLWDQHVALCQSAMRAAINSLEGEIANYEAHLPIVTGESARNGLK